MAGSAEAAAPALQTGLARVSAYSMAPEMRGVGLHSPELKALTPRIPEPAQQRTPVAKGRGGGFGSMSDKVG